MKRIQTPEDYKDYQADRLMFDVMQQRAKMAITHSNAKLEQRWREHVNGAEIREYRKAKGQGE